MNSERPAITLSAADMLLIVDLLRQCADAEAEALHNRLASYFNGDMRYSATVDVTPVAEATRAKAITPHISPAQTSQQP